MVRISVVIPNIFVALLFYLDGIIGEVCKTQMARAFGPTSRRRRWYSFRGMLFWRNYTFTIVLSIVNSFGLKHVQMKNEMDGCMGEYCKLSRKQRLYGFAYCFAAGCILGIVVCNMNVLPPSTSCPIQIVLPCYQRSCCISQQLLSL